MEPHKRLHFDCRLELPNHALFVGATQSGKTTLCLHLLSHLHLFHPKPCKVMFYYDQFQEKYLEIKKELAKQNVQLLLYQGFPNISLDTVEPSDGQTIILVDDFSEESSASCELARIATNGRHKNISLWLVWHSLFSKHPASRIICQNVRWYFFLPSLRLESQLRTFGSQLGMKSRLLYAFRACQENANDRYIVVDTGPRTPDILRVRSRIHDSSLQYTYT